MARKRTSTKSTTTPRKRRAVQKKKEEIHEEEEEENVESESDEENTKKVTLKNKKSAKKKDKDSEEDTEEEKPKRGNTKKSTPKKSKEVEEASQQLSASLASQSLGESIDPSDAADENAEKLQPNYISSKLDTKTLANRMSEVFEIFKKMKQANIPDEDNNAEPWDGFNELRDAVVDKKLLEHKDKQIRLYAACIIVEMFRIIVPRQPFSESDLKRIVNLFISEISNLTDAKDPLYQRRYFLLEQLSKLKFFVLLTEEQYISEGMHYVEELFTTFYNIVGSEKKRPHFALPLTEIMVHLVEALDTIPEVIIEMLLEPLLHKKKLKEETAAYHLSHNVLDRSTEYIMQNLDDYIIKQLRDIEKYRKNEKTYTKKRARIFVIIIEINLINSKLLMYVVPEIAQHLKDEDITMRTGVIQLLGEMFSAKESSLVTDFQSVFEEFLSRFSDKETKIRTYMVKIAAQIVEYHPTTIKMIDEKLCQRSMDTDEKVRRNVVETIVAIAEKYPTLISDELIEKLHDRTRDKKLALRELALKQCCSLWLIVKNERKWWWIVNDLMRYHGESSTDAEHKFFVEKVYDELLLPQDSSSRAKALLDIFIKLDNVGKAAFKQMLFYKKGYQLLVSCVVKDKYVEDEDDEESGENNRRKQIIQQLVKYIPGEGQITRKIWTKFFKLEDKESNAAIRLLNKALNPDTDFKTIQELKEKASSNNFGFGETKDAREAMRAIIERTAHTIVNRDVVVELLRECEKYLEDKNENWKEKALQRLHFLDHVAEFYGYLFEKSFETLRNLLNNEDPEIVVGILKVALFAFDKMEEKEADLDSQVAFEMEERLEELIIGGTPQQAKLAARVAKRAYVNPDARIFFKVYERLVLELEYGPNLPTILTALREIAILSPETFEENASTITTFVFDQVLDAERENDALVVQCQVLSIKLLVAAVSNIGFSQDSEDLKAKTTKLLFERIQAEEEQIRLTCARGIIKLAGDEKFKLQLTMEQFLQLAYVIFDNSIQVRSGICQTLFNQLKKTKLSIRFAAILLLGVGDVDLNQAVTVKRYISAMIAYFRGLIQKSTEKITLDHPVSYEYYPEYMLPYIIFLLAHHPRFNEEQPVFLGFQKIFYTYFDEVTKDTDNLSFLYQLISKIKQRKDALQPDSTNHLVMCDMAMLILNRCAEGKPHDTKAYPGKMYIPGFFKVRTAPHTPLRKFDSPRDMDTSTSDMTAIDTIKTLYLPAEFKLNEKIARTLGTPVTSRKNKTVNGKRKRNEAAGASSRKRSKKSDTSRSKKSEETVSPRTSLPRSAKKKSAYSDNEESDVSEDEGVRKKIQFSDEEKSEDEQENSESEEEEPAKSVPTARRRRQLNKLL